MQASCGRMLVLRRRKPDGTAEELESHQQHPEGGENRREDRGHTVNRQLEAKARAVAGLKGYVTNLDATAEFVIDAYHRLFHIEQSFRMSKHDL
jgi:hypothetical protein